MSGNAPVALAVADRVAEELLARLAPLCERIEVAGSVRRRKPEVGDLELVAIPTMTFERDASVLFGEPIETSKLHQAIDILRADGTLHRLDAEGPRYTKSRHAATGLQVDLFAVRPPAQWGVIFAIRTGPAAYSQWLVTEAKRRGHHVFEGALHRGSMHSAICETVPTPEEVDVFNALRLLMLPPEARS